MVQIIQLSHSPKS
uniref:Uncharacterized protein n=1 Tax=Rhizophora mucronata TaxID=61149 RepID=A0A2P2N2W5_RHIMU